ncbi:MAG: hypothetical protein GY803_23870 [Chloroflexi bacterium]|nr:hypothetical protein [Chloroflexota bacterium]
MSDPVLPGPEERRIAKLENQLAQAHATIEILQGQLRQLQAEAVAQKRAGAVQSLG